MTVTVAGSLLSVVEEGVTVGTKLEDVDEVVCISDELVLALVVAEVELVVAGVVLVVAGVELVVAGVVLALD